MSKKRKHPINRAEILHTFGYLSRVNVTGFVQTEGRDTNDKRKKTYLLIDLFVEDNQGQYMRLDHLWVTEGLFTSDMVGKVVNYVGEVRTYEKGTGRRSYELYPLEIVSVDDLKEPETTADDWKAHLDFETLFNEIQSELQATTASKGEILL